MIAFHSAFFIPLLLFLHVEHLGVEVVASSVEVLAGLDSVGLDVSSILSDVLVGCLDLRVGSGIQSSKGALLVEGSHVQLVSVRSLVLLHDLAGLLEALVVLLPALVLESSNLSEVLSGEPHL